MLIVDVIATPVQVPLRSPLRTALGDARYSESAVVEVIADDGSAGLGEISMIWHGNGSLLCREVNELIRPAVVGRRVADREAVTAEARRVLSFGRHSAAAVAAVEMALVDLLGRSWGVSAIDLFGGARRDRVRLSMSLSIAPVDQVLREARHYVEQGFTALKVKGDHDLDRVVEAASALRAEFGDALDLRVDLNMGAPDPKSALRAIAPLADLGVLSVEQPLAAGDLRGTAYLVEHSPVPIMLDESVWDESDAQRAIESGACDLVNVYVSEAGGLAAAQRLVATCELAGVRIAVGSMPELGIGTAAAAVVAFTAPRLDHPSDVCGFAYHHGDVVRHHLTVADGHLELPRAPGLGVELDHEALSRFRIDGAGRG